MVFILLAVRCELSVQPRIVKTTRWIGKWRIARPQNSILNIRYLLGHLDVVSIEIHIVLIIASIRQIERSQLSVYLAVICRGDIYISTKAEIMSGIFDGHVQNASERQIIFA